MGACTHVTLLSRELVGADNLSVESLNSTIVVVMPACKSRESCFGTSFSRSLDSVPAY